MLMKGLTSKSSQLLEVLRDTQKNHDAVNADHISIPTVMGNCETHSTRLKTDPNYAKSWLENPIMRKLAAGYAERHTAAQDETSQINELAAQVLSYGKAATIGRSICSVHYTDRETLKVRMPKEGKAKRLAGDTWSINTKGQRSTYVDVDTDKYLEAGDEWDQSQIENTEYDYLMAQTQECMYNLRKLESELIIAHYKTLQSASGIAGKITKGTGSGEIDDPTIDLLIGLRGKLTQVNRRPTAFVMSEATFTNLLKDDDLKNSEYLTSGAFDYETGMTNMQFLGANLMPTTLMAEDVIWAIDTNVAMLYAIRRDSLIEPYSRIDAGVHGLRITSRYGLEHGRKDGFAWWGA